MSLPTQTKLKNKIPPPKPIRPKVYFSHMYKIDSKSVSIVTVEINSVTTTQAAPFCVYSLIPETGVSAKVIHLTRDEFMLELTNDTDLDQEVRLNCLFKEV